MRPGGGGCAPLALRQELQAVSRHQGSRCTPTTHAPPLRRLLRFELLDCWADQQQRQQHGWALLQLRELASLAAVAESCAASGSGAREASRMLLLPLCTEYESAAEAAGEAGSAAAPRGPSLKLELSYCAQLCTMDAAEVAAAAAAATPAVQQQASGSPAKQARPAAAKAAAGAGGGGSTDDEDGENSLRLANRSTSSSGRQAQPAAPARAAAGGLGAAQSPARSIPSQHFLLASLSVEIIQASGLGAAVRAAAAAAGGGAGSSLGRAVVVGPHAFVRLALFPEGELVGHAVVGISCTLAFNPFQPAASPLLALCAFAADTALQAEAPPLQTAFVPQSFCPAWRSVHSHPLQLTAGMVQALASQASCKGADCSECLHPCRRLHCSSTRCPPANPLLQLLSCLPCRACGWRCGTAARAPQQWAAAAAGRRGRCCWALAPRPC